MSLQPSDTSDARDVILPITECSQSLRDEWGNYVTNVTTVTVPDAVALLVTLRERGLTLQADGDRLRWSGPRGVLTDELRQALTDQKSAVIALLQADASAGDGDNPMPMKEPHAAGDRLALAALVRPLTTYPCEVCGAALVMGAGDYGRLVCHACLQRHGSLAAALASLDAPQPPSNVIAFGQPQAKRRAP